MLQQTLNDSRNEINRLDGDNTLLREQNNLLQQTLNDSQNEINRTEGDYTLLREQNNLLQQTLNDSRNEIIVLSSQIEEIKKSISWKLTTKFHSRVIERIFPADSKCRNFYDLGLKSGRILINDGFSCLIQKYKARRLFLKSQKILIEPQNSKIRDDEQPRNSDVRIYSNNAKKTVTPHKSNVDVIVCVHNAYDDVKLCLESVEKYTSPPFSLILIDDGSEELTQKYLKNFAKTCNNAQLIRNNSARGYTFAANQGLKISSAPHVILLNSDTIVTYEWIDRIVGCAESDDKIGLVGPLSNTASWQSVPNIEDQGDWAKNTLPSEVTIEQMGRLIAKYSSRTYPKIPFINGFCLLIKRNLIDNIGYFDEENFGRGYGEENDYCLRALKAGWTFAVADDVYIYHSQSRSYSNEKRKLLCEHSV